MLGTHSDTAARVVIFRSRGTKACLRDIKKWLAHLPDGLQWWRRDGFPTELFGHPLPLEAKVTLLRKWRMARAKGHKGLHLDVMTDRGAPLVGLCARSARFSGGARRVSSIRLVQYVVARYPSPTSISRNRRLEEGDGEGGIHNLAIKFENARPHAVPPLFSRTLS